MTIFVGEGEHDSGYIPAGNAEVWVDDELRGVLRIEGEMLDQATWGSAHSGLRAVATTETRCLTRESVLKHRWVLKSLDQCAELIPFAARGGLRTTMHRHLLGIDSPASDYVADPLTQGPMLPENWDGDAWVLPDQKRYYLRAWNTQTRRVAYGRGKTYAEARDELLRDVARGQRQVEVTVTESA